MPITVVDTKNRQRARVRPGRRVQYSPTATEVTTYGAGPYPGEVAEVNVNGTVDISVTFPAPIAGYGTLNTTFDAPELAALVDGTVSRRLQNIRIGSAVGQASLVGPVAGR